MSADGKKKHIWTAVIIFVSLLISLVLFYPGGPVKCADGGSYGYSALTYSVWRIHSLHGYPTIKNGRSYQEYEVGWSVTILGIKVYDERHIESEAGLTVSEIESVKEEIDRAMNK